MSPPPRSALSAVPSVASATVAELRRQIEQLEGGAQARKPLPFGVAAVDDHLPGGGLARGALHEVVEAGPAAEFAGSATLFTAGITARLKGPVLWCLTRRDLFAPGLAAVVGEVTRLNLIASRRLQLAAEASGVTALLLRRW